LLIAAEQKSPNPVSGFGRAVDRPVEFRTIFVHERGGCVPLFARRDARRSFPWSGLLSSRPYDGWPSLGSELNPVPVSTRTGETPRPGLRAEVPGWLLVNDGSTTAGEHGRVLCDNPGSLAIWFAPLLCPGVAV
jgi:hypothetical protein